MVTQLFPKKNHEKHFATMASQEAICRLQIEQSGPASEEKRSQSEKEHLLPHDDISEPPIAQPPVPLETRLQWVKSISEHILQREKLDDDDKLRVRHWDFILRLDGSVENRAANTSPTATLYPARYRIPNEVIDRLASSQEKVQRAELFALGGLLYHVLAEKEIFTSLDAPRDDHLIHARFVSGDFPDDVWELPRAVRVLGCWCPLFAKELLAARAEDENLRSKFTSYVKKHPVLFGIQVVGGIASLASIVALPILGAVGFGAAGPVAGSAAAAWQSGLGLVRAGSIFSWCQSAAMGGAAVSGILATGLAGAGIAVGAAVAGVLDDIDTPASELRERFLTAWARDVGRD